MLTEEGGSNTAVADDSDLFDTEAHAEPVAKPTTIPDKFKGKSVEDMIQIALNAERKISEQGQEVGRLRRHVDQILEVRKPTTTQQNIATQQVRKPVTVDALLNDPEKQISSAIENSPSVQRAAAAEARVTQIERSLAQRAFEEKHPDFGTELQDPDFKTWVAANPIRAGLGNEAAKQNFEAATALFDMWSERKELVSGVTNRDEDEKLTDVTNQAQQQTVRPKVPKTVKASPQTDNASKRIWSRAALIALRMNVAAGDPKAEARWNDPGFQARMNQAYTEDRVK